MKPRFTHFEYEFYTPFSVTCGNLESPYPMTIRQARNYFKIYNIYGIKD